MIWSFKSVLPPQQFDAHLFSSFLNSDRYRLRFKNFKEIFDLYLVILGNYTFLGVASCDGKKIGFFYEFSLG